MRCRGRPTAPLSVIGAQRAYRYGHTVGGTGGGQEARKSGWAVRSRQPVGFCCFRRAPGVYCGELVSVVFLSALTPNGCVIHRYFVVRCVQGCHIVSLLPAQGHFTRCRGSAGRVALADPGRGKGEYSAVAHAAKGIFLRRRPSSTILRGSWGLVGLSLIVEPRVGRANPTNGLRRPAERPDVRRGGVWPVLRPGVDREPLPATAASASPRPRSGPAHSGGGCTSAAH